MPPRLMLGRDREVALVGSLLDDLTWSRGHLLLLTGEPGIGKTRLAEDVAARAQAMGAEVAWATAWQGDGAPPLWPWMQILRQVADSDDALTHSSPVAPSSSSSVRFTQLESIATVLRDQSSRAPLVVVIDDLQWADPASVRVLTFLASAVRDAPCLLVATFRTDELDRTTSAELARAGTTLAVPPLSDDMAAELLQSAVGGQMSPGATSAVVERSGGNPLFVWEFGQLIAQSGRFDVAPSAVPGAVAAVIERRLARLSEDTVALLRVGAIGGDPFSASLVASMTGAAVHEVNAVLAPALRDGLLAAAAAPGSFAFSHGLIREVAIEGIEAAQRELLHRTAATILEERAGADPAFHAVIADHLQRAGTAHLGEASTHWELAARHALKVVAYDEAAALFGRAADASGDHDGRRAHLVVDQSDALLLAGDLVRAREGFTRAAAAARSADEPELFARAVLGIGTGPIAWEVPIGDGAHADLVADALTMLPESATRLRSMLLARLSVTASTPATQGIARRRAQAALDLAEQVGDGALMGQALAALNDALAGPAHTMARRENADAIVELAGAAGDRALELLGYRFRVVADLEAGDIAAADHDIAAFAQLADQLRQPLVTWYVPLFRGMRALLSGDLDRAEQHHAGVEAAAAATGSPNAAMLAMTLGLGIDLARGRRPPVDLLEGLLQVDPSVWATYAAGSAMIAWHADDVGRAREMLALHADDGFSRLGDDGEHLTTLLMFGRVAIALDEQRAVRQVYELMRPHSGLWCVDGIAACCWGPVDVELGRLALALGMSTEASEHLSSARESVERAGAHLLTPDIDDLERRCGTPTKPQPPTESLRNQFRRDGQFWTLTFNENTVRLRDAKGLRDLARLLAEPGRELHVLDLAGSREAVQRSGDLGALLDARARAEYRRRLAELEDELADAETTGDHARMDKARDEREFLASELSAALGLGGRPRRAGDPVERARKAVSGRIRLTIGRIDIEHPTLARHLSVSVRTGTYCVYSPEHATTWEQ